VVGWAVVAVGCSAMSAPAAETSEMPSPWDGGRPDIGTVPVPPLAPSESAIVRSGWVGSAWAKVDLWEVDAVGSPSVRAMT